MANRASQILFASLLLLCAAFAEGQVSVAIAPDPHPQFLSSSGLPLAGGFLYTYQAGTNTLANTYVDSAGTIQNPDPIPLDATGAPSNGSTQTGIWLANQAYKFCAYNASLVQQWCADNITGYLGLLNLANAWTLQQTFTLPIIDLATDNQFVLGAGGNQTTLDFPPPTGNVTLHFPNTADTMVGRATTDTLTNKTLVNPTITGLTGGLTGPALSNFTIAAGAPAANNSNGESVILTASNATPLGSHVGGSVIVNPGVGAGGGASGDFVVGSGGVNGGGMQHKRAASCVTGAGAASTCDTMITWPFVFDDTSYTATCTIDTPTAVPYVLSTKTKSVNQITVTIANLTAVAASGTLNCIGLHD